MKVLGIDLGSARVGLALSDDLGMLAHPLETVKVKGPVKLVEHVANVIRREKVQTVIIGLPRNMDGSFGPAAEKTKEFGEKLRAAAPECEYRFWDERMTTVAAHKALHERGLKEKNTRSLIDQVAAQMILQGYLDAKAMQEPLQEPFQEP